MRIPPPRAKARDLQNGSAIMFWVFGKSGGGMGRDGFWGLGEGV